MAAEPTDYLALTAEHVRNPNADVVAGIVKYCGVALHDRDGRYVAATDQDELDRIVKGFCAKKLGLNAEAGAAAVAAAAQSMKATRMKHRVPFYYLVAEHAGKLGLLSGNASHNSGADMAGKPASHASSAASSSSTASGYQGSSASRPAADAPKAPAAPQPAPRPAAAVAPAPMSSATARPAAAAPTPASSSPAPSASRPAASASSHSATSTNRPAAAASTNSQAARSGSNWWMWVLPLLVALAAIWFFKGHKSDDVAETAAKPAATATATTTTPAAITVDNVDVSKNLTTAMSTLTSALPTVTDAASANAALPKLQEAGAAVTAVSGVASKFSAEQKTAVASMVNAGLPGLTDLVTKAEANAEAAGVLKPVLDTIIANLTGLTK